MRNTQQEPIAIIGMGCRFPGANNLQEFWTLLHAGKDAIQEVPADRWDSQRLYDPDRTVPGKMVSRWGGFLDQVDQFDWRAFRMLPREVISMDPQHRLLLEVAWEALEDVGLPFEEVAGSETSVSIGIDWNDYLRLHARNWSQMDEYTAIGNADSVAAHRLSYFFDLKGESVAVNNLCTSGLSALHLACQSLWAGEASLALAGGVSLTLSPERMIMVSKAGLLSTDRRCKTLDTAADGYVQGEGAGIVVLKPLSQVSRSDRVYALIRAIAVNHNGHNEWIIAASQTAQEALLRDAYRKAGVNPAFVDYVELHGTGFQRGDSIEANALGAVLGSCPERTHPCLIGSVKTNIGHLDAASGIASVIKVALSLSHQYIPPTLNLETLNPDIPLDDLHLAVPQTGVPWPEKAVEGQTQDYALAAAPQGHTVAQVAGVTTLAFSGANAHAVLTSYQGQVDKEQRQHEKGDEHVYRLLPISARTKQALDAMAMTYRNFLCNAETAPAFRDICYSASVRRTHHSYRLAVLGRTAQETAEELDRYLQEQGRAQSLSLYDPGKQQDLPPRLEALKALYMEGAEIDWSELFQGEECHCVSLPPYAWQRERLWPDWLDVEEISTPPEERSTAPCRRDTTRRRSGPNNIEINGREVVDVLTELWADVLGLEKVNAFDSFFALGGHSLLAQRLLSSIREIFQVELALKDLLEASTPSTCAEVVTQRAASQTNTGSGHTFLSHIEPDPKHRHEPFPTTDVQQAYWVGRYAAESGNVGNHAYTEVEATDLDSDRLHRALQSLIERHEMLRAVLLPDGQQQILEQVPPFEIKIVDLRGQEFHEQASQLEQIRHTLDHQLLPVDRWPAFELWISRLDERQVRLHLSIESIFIDAWSMNTLIHELIRFYHKPDLSLPPLALSFRDYVLAEASLQNSAAYQRSREYWLERLSSLPLAPDLPLVPETERIWNRPQFVHREARLEREHWQRLKAHAAQIGVTPSGVLLTAFALVLARWSKTARFSLNLSTFNRLPLHPQVNEIVGDFTSLLVLAIDHTTPASFKERAKCLQDQLWQDLDHSSYSGIAVLRDLAKMQGEGMKAIMPIVFTSLLIQDTANPLPPPWGKTLYCVSQTPQVWLDHQVLETGGELVFHWQSVDAMFPPGLIDDMFAAYCQLLQRLVSVETSWVAIGPDSMGWDILPEKQRALLAHVNATEAPVSDKLLHTFFLEQVTQRPEQLALISPTRPLTYKQMYSGALQLAHQLRDWGARPNQLVGVVMEKGWEQVIAVLGILQSGAAYLPIDASLPRERLWYLLEDGLVGTVPSACPVVVTQSWIDRRTEWPKDVKRIWVDSLDLDEEDIPMIDSIQGPDDLAYVIYTSGSTGEPKGVMIDHRGAVNTILDINRRFGVSNTDRVLALSALNFDLSVYDIFGLLAAGGTIVLPNEKTARDPAYWLKLIEQERVTIWNTVPALLQMLVEYAEAHSRTGSLRLALLSGDWIPLSLPDQIKELIPNIQVISLGGATEASIWSILYPVHTVEPSWKSIPYGKPMCNQRFFVLNEKLEPCPIWVAGHLYIGGVGLAKGYWRDEEKTHASFLLHPYTGERLYRTGDLGRYLPDGNIEFLGREDFQVKIRGYRIELGEIEETLARHPDVQRAIVLAVGENQSERRLVAYVVPKPVNPLTTADVRYFLTERLPSYMIPTSFLILDTLPLTANGKVDRKALSTELAQQRGAVGTRTGASPVPTAPVRVPTAPVRESPLVAQITDLIRGVLNLKVERIDPTRNLLEYGATSMNIFRIAHMLESQLHIHLKFSQLFRLSTINAIATYCEKHLVPNEAFADVLGPGSENGTNHTSVSFNLLLDPVEREQFKRMQPGLRHVNSATPPMQLIMPELKDEVLRKYVDRRSARTFREGSISFRRFSEFLGCLQQISLEGKPKYQWGSAGGLYPIQAYIYIKPGGIEGIDHGIYYYHPVMHHLSLITPHMELESDVFGLINQPIFEQAAFALFLIGQMKAIEPLYAELSRDFCLIEAGEIAQLLEMSASSHQIALCQTGGAGFKKIEHLFALEEGSVYLHSLLGGALDVNVPDSAAEQEDWEEIIL